jgi:phytoene dehydrogenase-like protein
VAKATGRHFVMTYDAIIVGSGPNGLAAAIELARAGLAVLVVEAASEIGGGARSAALTLPGFVHDVCSAVHPLAKASPFFRSLPLAEHGLMWIDPPAALAHPFDDGTAVLVSRSVAATCATLGPGGASYARLMHPLVRSWPALEASLLGPPRWPRHPLAMARFGALGLRSAAGVARTRLDGVAARALFAGLAAHSMLRLEQAASAAFGLVLGISAHVIGWPLPQGGAQRLSDALAAYLRSLGGQILTDTRVQSLDQLPAARALLCDVTPRQLLALDRHRLPGRYRRALGRYRYGPAAFKVDWALEAPVPWKAAACARAGTVHLGATDIEIAACERAVAAGEHPERPFVLLAQPSLFDPSRAPPGKQTLWAYCHVPLASTVDMTERIERQIERFAPGFRERIVARHVLAPAALERHNANLVGGDINGGTQDLGQLFLRPTARTYSTPAKGLYLCSASTPPGGGVHGMCGYFAARAALRDLR